MNEIRKGRRRPLMLVVGIAGLVGLVLAPSAGSAKTAPEGTVSPSDPVVAEATALAAQQRPIPPRLCKRLVEIFKPRKLPARLAKLCSDDDDRKPFPHPPSAKLCKKLTDLFAPKPLPAFFARRCASP